MKEKHQSYLDPKILYSTVKEIFIITILICALGAGLIPACKLLELPLPWLYINPAYTTNTSLSWTSGVWASILGIHGTIAALSITFMSMFVTQVTTSTENSFESVCRILLLRKNNFLKFSIDAICGLIIGVLFIVIGGGIIQYSISMAISIYFIISYMKMYYKLYSVTENQRMINEILFDELVKTGSSYHQLKIDSNKSQEKFSTAISLRSNIVTSVNRNHLTPKSIFLDLMENPSTKTIISFREDKIEELDHFIKSINKDIKLELNIPFLLPAINIKARLLINNETDLPAPTITKISNDLTQCFQFENQNPTYDSFKSLESCVIENIYHSLTSGNENSLELGISTLSMLSSESNHFGIIKQLCSLIASSERSKFIEVSMMEMLFKKLFYTDIGEDKTKSSLFITESLLDLSMYIYEKEKYESLYKKINLPLENRTSFGDDDKENPYLRLYIEKTISHISRMYYSTFKTNTKYLTRKLSYIGKIESNDLNDRQMKLIFGTREMVSLLIVRLTHLEKINLDSNIDEVMEITSLIKDWISPAFLEEIYFEQKTYEALFKLSSEFSSIDAERQLTETEEESIVGIRTRYKYLTAIAILLYKFPEKKNHLDLSFIRDKKSFIENTKITSIAVQEIIEYISSPEFTKIINMITNDKEPNNSINRNVAELSMHLEKLKSEITKKVILDVETSELDDDIIEKYSQEITRNAMIHINKIMTTETAKQINKEKEKPDYINLINKREVIPSLDGVHYSMNSENHALKAVYSFINKELTTLKNNGVYIEEITDIEALEDNKFITIEYKVKNKMDTYKFTKGIRMNDNDGFFGFKESGLYYLNIEKELEIEVNKNEPVSTVIKNIDKDNVNTIANEYKINTKDENLFLRAGIEISLNIFIKRKEHTKFLFISEKNCKLLNEAQEKQFQQLAARTDQGESDNNIKK